MLNYAVHASGLARADPSYSYLLAHMTTIQLHTFDRSGGVSFNAGPPSHESVAIHYLKSEAFPNRFRRRLRLLWSWLWRATGGMLINATSSAARPLPCWPLIRFRWRPAARTIRCMDSAVWHQYRWQCTARSQHCRPPTFASPHAWRLSVRAAVWTCDADAADVTVTHRGGRCPARCDARPTYVCD